MRTPGRARGAGPEPVLRLLPPFSAAGVGSRSNAAIAGRDAGEAGEKIRSVLGEAKKTAAIERSGDTDSSDRLESEPEANQALGVKVRMAL